MPKEPTICMNCKHIMTSCTSSLLLVGSLELTCDKGEIVDFVTGQHQLCKERNTKGRCTDFEPSDSKPGPVSAEVN